jgi:esterase/lipase superfamily enzyme
MRIWHIYALILIAGCAPRGAMVLMPEGIEAQETRAIYVGTTRSKVLISQSIATDPEMSALERGRSDDTRYLRVDVAIPPDRVAGELTIAQSGKTPDPRKDFLAAHVEDYPSASALRADLAPALRAQGGEAVIFVHGFNTTFAEGLYRMAQLGQDLELPGVLVHYAWPSAGQPLGYAYDRDSALFARDGLHDLILELSRAGATKIVLLGHSMGSQLVMETLRDLSYRDPNLLQNKIAGVALMAPDIDVSLFRAQAHDIGDLPEPFMIFTSKRDPILRLSARLSGEADRLGLISDPERLADLRVTLVEVSAFSGSDPHFLLGSSPSLMALLRNGSIVNAALASGQQGRAGLIPGVVLTVQNATSIALSPITD